MGKIREEMEKVARENAIKELKELQIDIGSSPDDLDNSPLYYALDIAIQALEQQPCEDWYDVPSDEMTVEQARQAVKDLRKKLAEYLEQQPCEDVEEYGMNEQMESSSEKPNKSEIPTGWIPVSERLPEDGTWNLFTDGKTISVERYKFDAIDHFFPNGRWFPLEEAVAWMPLPERYKEEEE